MPSPNTASRSRGDRNQVWRARPTGSAAERSRSGNLWASRTEPTAATAKRAVAAKKSRVVQTKEWATVLGTEEESRRKAAQANTNRHTSAVSLSSTTDVAASTT